MTYIVEAVDEAVKLLFLVMQHPSSGLTDLSKRAGLPKMRAFRLLSTLEHTGLITKDSNSAYHLAYRSLVLGAAAQKQLDLARVAAPFVRKLGEACDESVVLRVLDGFETLCIDCFLPERAVRVNSTVGNRRAVHIGASGRLLLAFASQHVRDDVLGRGETPYEAKPTVEAGALEQELDLIRQRHYATSPGGYLVDAVSVAAPVMAADGTVIAALTIACPHTRSSDDRLAQFIELATGQAAEVSAAMGYRA